MAGKQSHAVHEALKAKGKRKVNIYKLAAKFGVAPSTLYRAIKRSVTRGNGL